MRSSEKVPCPICDGNLTVCGSRPRKVIRSNGEKITLIVRRLYCETCHKIHHELPDAVVPYKHHSARVIEEALRDDKDSAYIPCENSTIRRLRIWFSLLRPYIEGALRSLIEIHRKDEALQARLKQLLPLDGSGLTGWLKKIVRILVNSGRWVQTRFASAVQPIRDKILPSSR